MTSSSHICWVSPFFTFGIAAICANGELASAKSLARLDHPFRPLPNGIRSEGFHLLPITFKHRYLPSSLALSQAHILPSPDGIEASVHRHPDFTATSSLVFNQWISSVLRSMKQNLRLDDSVILLPPRVPYTANCFPSILTRPPWLSLPSSGLLGISTLPSAILQAAQHLPKIFKERTSRC